MNAKLAALAGLLALPIAAGAADQQTQALARDIFKQCLEINTTQSSGSTTLAAEAMAQRLRDAGFPAADVQVLGADPKKHNMVARLRGRGKRKPILWMCHLDVVEARREDWSTDPFQFLEKDGHFYGRGSHDIKGACSLLVATFIRLKKEGYKPDRDVILALTADEEVCGSCCPCSATKHNGVEWLLQNHRGLIDAEFFLNPDAGNFEMDQGKKRLVGIQASEKLYVDFQLEARNKGGHSSRPRADNAIYQLAAALGRLARHQFPFELNEVTRAYFAKQSEIVGGQDGADMKAILNTPLDAEAIVRLSSSPFYNARLRSTCVATRLEAGHANNALAGSAKAIVNCRVLPGHSAAEIHAELVKVLADPEISVTVAENGPLSPKINRISSLRPDVVGTLEKVVGRMWPGLPVVPFMDAGGSDNAISRDAGIPSYGIPGMFLEVNDNRAHGKDERIPVASFYESLDFFYNFNKALTGSP